MANLLSNYSNDDRLVFASCRVTPWGDAAGTGLGGKPWLESLTSMVSAHSRMCRWKVGVRLSKVTSPDFAVFSNNARCMFGGETGTLSIMRRLAPMRAAHLARFHLKTQMQRRVDRIHPPRACFPSSPFLLLPFVVMAQLRPSSVASWRGREPIAYLSNPQRCLSPPASPAKGGWLQSEPAENAKRIINARSRVYTVRWEDLVK